jgi:peptidoglycan hydrolase-like protein with peptidoglycan-binding domain
MRAGAARIDDDDFAEAPSRFWRLPLSWLLRRPKDAVAALLAAAAALTILINALFLQSGPHPAPIFANRPPVTAISRGTQAVPVPQPRTAEVSSRPRSRIDLIADIQRELARRGFYDGSADGVYGPKTDSAIRDFEQAAGLRPTAEPNDVLLSTIARSTLKAKPAAQLPKNDPIAELLVPSRRIVAIQRALSDFGYGQIKPSGSYDVDTRRAIERFERENKLPVTGQISERLTRQLTVMTGRPLD